MIVVLLMFACLFVAEWWIRVEARRDAERTLGRHVRRTR